jgi:hypothetical protein
MMRDRQLFHISSFRDFDASLHRLCPQPIVFFYFLIGVLSIVNQEISIACQFHNRLINAIYVFEVSADDQYFAVIFNPKAIRSSPVFVKLRRLMETPAPKMFL